MVDSQAETELETVTFETARGNDILFSVNRSLAWTWIRFYLLVGAEECRGYYSHGLGKDSNPVFHLYNSDNKSSG